MDEITPAGRFSHNKNFMYSEFLEINDALDYLKRLLQPKAS